ncbi:uncharacterized protein P174DRAFT_473398 [Aspergillus novofumigatus IBT 16806]|uniref:Lysine-specific metallo-endopeptidase domain-containing protein n=1 Tax=Aspergillus novofumigatus (strain IBT 16806) TaxID=1392255 RepID=A0A2I1BTE6_ASPN1|nr:uncharacterized protein P174DRAFT_473398 [Aspergillus novofumigatus IBT 16806]PKX88626.1 hypothetical protein P174DRAFT_473398 [Aspergillus novofumigatus IBT 16806]
MNFCLQNSARWLLNWIGIFMFIGQSCALDIGPRPVTRSGSGTYGGTCYGTDADLSAIYTEAIDLAQVALDSLNSYATSATVRATVETFFGINPIHPIDSAQFAYVKYIFGQIIAFSTSTEEEEISQPGFFCDDSWRWRTEMDYGSDGQMNGKTISQATGGATKWSWWSPLYKSFLGTGPGCVHTNLEATLGFTVVFDEQKVYTITMCPYSFTRAKRKDSLSAWRSKEKIIADGTPLGAALSTPGTLLHELAHLVTRQGLLSSKCGYTCEESKAKAVKNADTYTWFATAMYLDQCDWSRQICAQSASRSTVAKRSNNQTSTDMPLMRRSNRRTLLPRVLTGLQDDLE